MDKNQAPWVCPKCEMGLAPWIDVCRHETIVLVLESDETKAAETAETMAAAVRDAAAKLGKKGGKKGGPARAKKLSKQRRREIASKASRTRWDTAKAPAFEVEYTCAHCGEKFSTCQALGGHVSNNHGTSRKSKKGHTCKHCGDEFPTGQGLGGHVATVHADKNKAKTYKCKKCGEGGFANIQALGSHVRHNHGKKRPVDATDNDAILGVDPSVKKRANHLRATLQGLDRDLALRNPVKYELELRQAMMDELCQCCEKLVGHKVTEDTVTNALLSAGV